jgi:hypothetical protein
MAANWGISDMQKSSLAILILLSGPAYAQSSGLKPGLWELTPVSQVMDGHDLTAQISAAQAKMQQAMSSLPPEQRKQMEEMLSRQGTSPQILATGSTRICVSAAMAAKNVQIVDPKNNCEPAKVSQSGDTASFEFSCTSDGRTSVGKGESTFNGDTVVTKVDMTMTDAHGSHHMQSETQMKYLGADCHGIKPVDQMAKVGAPLNSESKAH